MRKLGRTSSDALELLLDTVCSMFGAILLIAILVALMAQTAKVDSPSDQASTEMLQRKIATAEADLAETHRLTTELTTPSDSPTTDLAAEKQKLDKMLAAAREQRDRMNIQLQDQVSRQAVDFSTEWKKLAADLSALEHKQEELTNTIKSQDQNRARLDGRTADVAKLIQQEVATRVLTLRFPKERGRTKRAVSIICKFGKIYPLMDVNGRKNDSTITWTSKDGDTELSSPVQALGWTTSDNIEAIERLLSNVPKSEIYLAFYVYPDSFDAFRFMRDKATAKQLEFGVELERPSTDLLWSSEGSSPPPL